MGTPDKNLIGQILCEKGYLKPSQLNHALMAQEGYGHLQIGHILLTLGYVTAEQLDEALSRFRQFTNKPFQSKFPAASSS